MNNMFPVCVIFTGLPASGKTTIRDKVISAITNTIGGRNYVYSTDDLVQMIADDNGLTYSEAFEDSIDDARRMADMGFGAAVREGMNIFVDATTLTQESRKKFIDEVSKSHSLVSIFFDPPKSKKLRSELNFRLNNRPGKEIPLDVFENMVDSYEEPTMDEGFVEIFKLNIYGKVES